MPKTNSNLVRPLAPEEIKPGAYVIVLDEVLEYLPCCFDGFLPPSEPVKIRWLPRDPELLEVLSPCMPYVSARRPPPVHETSESHSDTSWCNLVRCGAAPTARTSPQSRDR